MMTAGPGTGASCVQNPWYLAYGARAKLLTPRLGASVVSDASRLATATRPARVQSYAGRRSFIFPSTNRARSSWPVIAVTGARSRISRHACCDVCRSSPWHICNAIYFSDTERHDLGAVPRSCHLFAKPQEQASRINSKENVVVMRTALRASAAACRGSKRWSKPRLQPSPLRRYDAWPSMADLCTATTSAIASSSRVGVWAGTALLASFVLCANATAASTQYAVDGLTVGTKLNFDKASYRDHKCSPSDQFDGLTWCQITRTGRKRRASYSPAYSILHSPE